MQGVRAAAKAIRCCEPTIHAAPAVAGQAAHLQQHSCPAACSRTLTLPHHPPAPGVTTVAMLGTSSLAVGPHCAFAVPSPAPSSAAATASACCCTCAAPSSGWTVKRGESQRLRGSGRSNLHTQKGGVSEQGGWRRCSWGSQLFFRDASKLRTVLANQGPATLLRFQTLSTLHAHALPTLLANPPAGQDITKDKVRACRTGPLAPYPHISAPVAPGSTVDRSPLACPHTQRSNVCLQSAHNTCVVACRKQMRACKPMRN